MDLAELYKPIPFSGSMENCEWKDVPIAENHEKLVDISNISDRIYYDAEYYKQGIPGALRECYVREGIVGMLLNVIKVLPVGCSLFIYDTYRPCKVQEFIFNNYVKKLQTQNPEISEEVLIQKAQEFVSLPSNDSKKPSPHLTGGAIDLTIMDHNGQKLPMETGFDSFTDVSHTRYFEEKIIRGEELSLEEINYCMNRRMLYNIMTSVGFTNYPFEWWHFDYGNQFWGYAKKQTAFYGPCDY